MASQNMKDIANYEGIYKVSENGNIFKILNNGFFRQLKPTKTTTGYYTVGLKKNGQGISKYVHRLVMEAFYPILEKLEVNHKDFDRSNNRLNNLEWVTRQQNATHRKQNCRYSNGLSHVKSNLNENDIRFVKKCLADKSMTLTALSRVLESDTRTLKFILNDDRWNNAADLDIDYGDFNQ